MSKNGPQSQLLRENYGQYSDTVFSCFLSWVGVCLYVAHVRVTSPQLLLGGDRMGLTPQHPEYISHVVCVIFHLRLSVFKNEIMLFVKDSCFFPDAVTFGGVQHGTV